MNSMFDRSQGASLLLAQAIRRVLPQADVVRAGVSGIFSYVDVCNVNLTPPSFLSQLEEEMRKVIKEAVPFENKEMFLKNAVERFRFENQPTKALFWEGFKETFLPIVQLGKSVEPCVPITLASTQDVGIVRVIGTKEWEESFSSKKEKVLRILAIADEDKKVVTDRLKDWKSDEKSQMPLPFLANGEPSKRALMLLPEGNSIKEKFFSRWKEMVSTLPSVFITSPREPLEQTTLLQHFFWHQKALSLYPNKWTAESIERPMVFFPADFLEPWGAVSGFGDQLYYQTESENLEEALISSLHLIERNATILPFERYWVLHVAPEAEQSKHCILAANRLKKALEKASQLKLIEKLPRSLDAKVPITKANEPYVSLQLCVNDRWQKSVALSQVALLSPDEIAKNVNETNKRKEIVALSLFLSLERWHALYPLGY